MLADWVLVGPESARQGLIDDGHSMSVVAVMLGKQAAAQEPDSHGLEIIRGHDGFLGEWLLVQWKGPALDLKIAVRSAIA